MAEREGIDDPFIQQPIQDWEQGRRSPQGPAKSLLNNPGARYYIKKNLCAYDEDSRVESNQ